jgi:uncharacterized protein (DUF1501 family)
MAGMTSLALSSPEIIWADPALSGNRRQLVLIELQGGNDGLNTVIPYADPLYRRIRSSLAVQRDAVIPLTDNLGLNPVLAPLMPQWQGGDIAFVLGVGYEQPNRSHFRSIDIWETASGSQRDWNNGWVAEALGQMTDRSHLVAEGVIMGDYEAGPVEGPDARFLVMNSPSDFSRNLERYREVHNLGGNPSLHHILSVQADILAAARSMETRIAQAPALGVEFPTGNFASQLRDTALLIAAQVPLMAIKVTLKGFDLHADQREAHDTLLGEMAAGISAFQQAMVNVGCWDDVVVMTYSEFGRRPAENGNSGTDHGTSAPHMILGGRVRGGLYGRQPDLSDLTEGDLGYFVDYRSLYATICRQWWGLPDDFLGASFPVINCIV